MIISGLNLSGVTFVSSLNVPDAPTIGTATAASSTSATVTFTASAFDGGSPITSYTAVSSPGSITGYISQSGSGTITVSGLTAGTTYTFTVYATNSVGNSASSSASNSITPPVIGQRLWSGGTSPFGYSTMYNAQTTTTWVVPAGVSSISVVCIGAGGGGQYRDTYVPPVGGGGGALAYVNNISVTPGETLYVTYGSGHGGTNTGSAQYYGSASTVWRGTPFTSGSTLLCGAGGGRHGYFSGTGASVQPVPGDGGRPFVPGSGAAPSVRSTSGTDGTSGWGVGGDGGYGAYGQTVNAGGGGAGGYGAKGGYGAFYLSSSNNGSAQPGQGNFLSGGGGGGYATSNGNGGAGGGGTPMGSGLNNAAGTNGTTGGDGGGGTATAFVKSGKYYGGGGGTTSLATWQSNNNNMSGGQGCVRIIYPGDARQFPSTRTADE